MPVLFRDYNLKARGVDRANQLCTYFKYPHRNNKWWHTVFHHFLQITINNSYTLYKYSRQDQEGKRKMTHKEFILFIVEALLYSNGIKNQSKEKCSVGTGNDKKNNKSSKKKTNVLKENLGNTNVINTTLENFHFCAKFTKEERKSNDFFICNYKNCEKKKPLYYCKKCSEERGIRVALCLPVCFTEYHFDQYNLKRNSNE